MFTEMEQNVGGPVPQVQDARWYRHPICGREGCRPWPPSAHRRHVAHDRGSLRRRVRDTRSLVIGKPEDYDVHGPRDCRNLCGRWTYGRARFEGWCQAPKVTRWSATADPRSEAVRRILLSSLRISVEYRRAGVTVPLGHTTCSWRDGGVSSRSSRREHVRGWFGGRVFWAKSWKLPDGLGAGDWRGETVDSARHAEPCDSADYSFEFMCTKQSSPTVTVGEAEQMLRAVRQEWKPRSVKQWCWRWWLSTAFLTFLLRAAVPGTCPNIEWSHTQVQGRSQGQSEETEGTYPTAGRDRTGDRRRTWRAVLNARVADHGRTAGTRTRTSSDDDDIHTTWSTQIN